jgi:hypothetical protein
VTKRNYERIETSTRQSLNHNSLNKLRTLGCVALRGTGLPGQSQCSSVYFFTQPANVSSCGYSCRTWAMSALKPFSRTQRNISANSFGIIILATKVGIGAAQGLCPDYN